MKVYTVYYSHPVSHRDGQAVMRSQEFVRQLIDLLTPDGFRVYMMAPGRGEELLAMKDIPLPPAEDSATGFIPGRRVTRLEIIERNFQDIDACDFVLCDLTGALQGSTSFVPGKTLGPEYRSDGCLSEISYARGRGKRGILAMEYEGNVNDRFFQRHVLQYREYTIEAAVHKMMMLLLPVPPTVPASMGVAAGVGFQ